MPILEQTTAWGTRNVLIPDGAGLEVMEEEETRFGKQTMLSVDGVVTICLADGNVIVHGPFLVDGSRKAVCKQLNL